jgi:transposase
LQQEYAFLKKRLEQSPWTEQKVDSAAEKPIVIGETLTPAEERRKERMASARQLHSQGWTQKSIARHLNVNPKTVRRYLQSASPKSSRSRGHRLLDSFQPYILKRWNEGCRNASQLFREIKPQGFAGEMSIVRLYVQQLRLASRLPPKVRSQPGEILNGNPPCPPSLRKLTGLIVKRPENRSEEGEQLLSNISSGQPKLTATIELARSLATIIRQQQAAELDVWLERAGKSGYRVWHNFAAGLSQDYDAVRAALQLPWSNGPTEGHINRLKYLKRLMYGRGKYDLLRKRVLWQGRWSFT